MAEITTSPLFFLIPLSLLVVLGVLGFGLFTLARGGEFAKQNSNKVMRWRIISQALAVVVIITVIAIVKMGKG